VSLRLKKLSSAPEAFAPIVFTEGVNLVLGEQTEKGTGSQKNKVNGVGKSVFVDFLHFTLCRGYQDTRVSRIPPGTLPPDLIVVLDLEIHGTAYQIRRAIATPGQVTVIDVEKASSRTFPTIDEANQFLGDLLFAGQPLAAQTGFRQLLSLLMRDEASGFRDYLNPMSPDKRAVPPLEPHLYLLGIDHDVIQRYAVLKKEWKAITQSIGQLEKILTDNKRVRMADLPAKLNEERERVAAIEEALAQLKTDPAFKAVEGRLIEIEGDLLKLRAERKQLAWQIEQIRIVPRNERVDTTDIKIVYDRIRTGLGELVKKSLEQAMSFKAEIERFQQSLVKEELEHLETRHREVQKRIGELAESHRKLTQKLDNREVLSELRNGLTAASERSESYRMLSSQFQMHERQKNEKADLKLQLEMQLGEVRQLMEAHQSIETAMEARIIELHKRLMSSSQASFKFTTADTTRGDRPFGIDVRIKADRSKSIDEAKVFIYDFALLSSSGTQHRHPGFLLHDNILEVDNDTLIQSLNFLGELEESGYDFQYILTLNRDKIEPSEIADQITLDIPSHTVARFSKEAPFLRTNYQEI
jgi:uncharacterized protein YydD (DUF2326 family)